MNIQYSNKNSKLNVRMLNVNFRITHLMIALLTFHCDKVDSTNQFVNLMVKGLIVNAVRQFTVSRNTIFLSDLLNDKLPVQGG